MAVAFQDFFHQQHFDRTGWTHGPFLSTDDLDEIREGFARLGRPNGDGLRAALRGEDFGNRCDAYCLIRPIIERRLRGVLTGYRVCLAQWMIQSWGDLRGDAVFHQDWSIVDERRMRSIHLWIPMADVDDNRGGLEVVSGTHRLSLDHRAYDDDSRFRDLSGRLHRDYRTPVSMRAGEAVFYDGALLHRSGANRAFKRRVAVGVALIPDGAPMFYCHRISPDAVEVFSVDDSFYWRHLPDSRPEGGRTLGVVASSCRQHSCGALGWLSPVEEPVRSLRRTADLVAA